MSGFVYTNDILKKIQLIELDMLHEVDSICRKNNINYQIVGGTLLGAVRHKGFIPWDDDIDICMARADYEKFCTVCSTELDSRKYFLQTYKTDPGYLWEYGRILRKDTVFMREHQEMLKMQRGIFLDIFVCDGMPEHEPAKSIFNFQCWLCRKILYSPVGSVYEKNKLMKILYRCLNHIPKEFAHRKFESLSKKYDGKETRLVRVLGWGSRQERQGFLRKWLNESCELEFEDMFAKAPADWNDYLRYTYGDYMKLPPKEEQIPKHTPTYVDIKNV